MEGNQLMIISHIHVSLSLSFSLSSLCLTPPSLPLPLSLKSTNISLDVDFFKDFWFVCFFKKAKLDSDSEHVNIQVVTITSMWKCY